MLIVIPFFSGDKPLAISLLDWIEQLGGVHNHDCLLVVDQSTDSGGVIEKARMAFANVYECSAEPVGAQGTWGTGTTDATAANEMWLTACIYIQHKFPTSRWFWLESDALPTRPTWADEIEAEDRKFNHPFTGAFVNIPPHEPHMSGIAVYPPTVADYSLDMAIPGKIAWDYAGRRDTVGKKKAHFTDLIQHEYRINGAAPTFPTIESLSVIKPRTAIFHRCKDGSAISRLRERLSGEVGIAKRSAIAAVQVQPLTPPPELVEENQRLRERIFTLEKKVEFLTPKTAPSRRVKKSKLSPERRQQLSASLAKARAAKKAKAA